MCKSVIKRDGRVVSFDHSRIFAAIKAAFNAAGIEEKYSFICRVATKISEHEAEVLHVEDIQDIIIFELKEKYPEVALIYKDYRHKRDLVRKSKRYSVFKDIVDVKHSDVAVENGNMNADTPSGMVYKFASEISKEFSLDVLIDKEFVEAHTQGVIHIHDLDYYATKSLTCLQHPLDKVLTEGFSAGHGESRPSKRIETASILGCISMEAVQNEMHGGQAIPAFDFYLAPYVRRTFQEEIDKIADLLGKSLTHLYDVEIKDYIKEPLSNHKGVRMTDKRIIQKAINNTVDRVHQSMEAFIHNMNTIHSRGGNQVVFSSINYGTDTSAEGRCIIREILNATYQGVGNSKTAIFPIQIWKSKTGVSYKPEDPNYDLYKLACKVTAKRFFPNYINLDADYNTHEFWKPEDPNRFMFEPSTMGCRTRVFENRFGLKTSVGRGNISFTTINLPRIALEVRSLGLSKEGSLEELKSRVIDRVEFVAKQLDSRYKFQAKALKRQFPLLMSGLWTGSSILENDDSIEPVLNQGTLGIGFIGLAECLVALFGKHHGESTESQEIGLELIKSMADKASELSLLYKHNYSILATPAEGLSGRFTKIDRAKFGTIKGVTDREFYTNSNHIPVYYKCTADHKAEIECPYHKYTLGGHIFYVEQDGDPTHNPKAIMTVVDMLHHYNGGYASINYNQNVCYNCGHLWNGKDTKCPKCSSSDIDTLQRITGYLVGTTKRWNKGKLAELKERTSHDVN